MTVRSGDSRRTPDGSKSHQTAPYNIKCSETGGSQICSMFPSYTCLIHESRHAAISKVGVNKNLSLFTLCADLSGDRPKSIISYSINLGKAICQLKVEGAIIWVWDELASQ